jgi:hypothetical protein
LPGDVQRRLPLWKTFWDDRDHHSGHRDRPSNDLDQLIGIIPESVIGINPES